MKKTANLRELLFAAETCIRLCITCALCAVGRASDVQTAKAILVIVSITGRCHRFGSIAEAVQCSLLDRQILSVCLRPDTPTQAAAGAAGTEVRQCDITFVL
jgi:hypothetical protein